MYKTLYYKILQVTEKNMFFGLFLLTKKGLEKGFFLDLKLSKKVFFLVSKNKVNFAGSNFALSATEGLFSGKIKRVSLDVNKFEINFL